MAIAVAITSPTPGSTIDPDDALVFVVTDAELPDTLTADVTLPDGTVERAWDADQAVNGYIGSLEVDGDERTYTIRRPIGWPFGPLSVTVTAGNEEGAAATSFGPYMETDQSSGAPGGELVKAIPVDFDALPAGMLTMIFTQGDVRQDPGNFGGCNVILGGTGPLYFDGTIVWDGFSAGGGGPAYQDILPILVGQPTVPFLNPGGIVNLNFTGNSGSTGIPAGFRNFAFTLGGAGGGPEEDSDTATWDVDTDLEPAVQVRTIIQYRESEKLNKMIRLHRRLLRVD